MPKPYFVGDQVAIRAVVKRCNATKELVILSFPDGSETQPMDWDQLADLEVTPCDTVQQDVPLNSDGS